LWPLDVGEAHFQGVDDAAGFPDGKGCLGGIGELIRIDIREIGRLFGGLDQDDLAGVELAHGADHFRVALVADQQDATAALVMALYRRMHFLHQRTGGVHRHELALFGVLVYCRGDPVGAENRDGPGGHFVQFLHEHGALVAEALHHELVVHDFMSHIDGRAEFFERLFHDADGTLHTRAKTAGRGEINLHKYNVPIPARRFGKWRRAALPEQWREATGSPLPPYAISPTRTACIWSRVYSFRWPETMSTAISFMGSRFRKTCRG